MKRQGGWIAIVVVLATNALVLSGVSISRAGRPEARVELNESQLQLVPLGEENSGLMMRLVTSYTNFQEERPWFDRRKLGDLGFDTRVAPSDPAASSFYRRVPAKQAFIVLEWERDQVVPVGLVKGKTIYSAGRLAAVDVGRDPKALRAQYSDASRFIITRGVVRLRHRNGELHGSIIELRTPEIYVPLPYSRSLGALAVTAGAVEERPRFKTTLCYGATYEPRICGVELLPATAQQ